MFRKHVIRHLSAYLGGKLSAGEHLRIQTHLDQCRKCREAYEEIRFGARLASTLSISNVPDSLWSDLYRIPEIPRRRWRPLAVLAGVGLAAVLLIVLSTEILRTASPSWEVAGLRGTSRLRPGEVLQTDSTSEAQIKIANIGQLTIDPNTRIRLLVTQRDQHRIALDRGKLEARTWAPPRLFIVETPSATAVDLGCRYTLEVEEDGSSLLHVTLGLVALDRGAGETIVPAGAFCRTRSGRGPGTPFFEDSSPRLQSALEQVDALPEGPERSRQLEIVLRETHIRDGLSLWHLLPRVGGDSRGLIYDRLAQLLPPPPEVTRDGVIRLDPKTLDNWKKVVSQLWQ